MASLISVNELSAPIAQQINNQQLSAIATLNEKAAQMARSGRRVIKLSGGDPSHVPEELLSILSGIQLKADASNINYSPIAGFERLRSRLALIASERCMNKLAADNILVCSGGCSGLFLTFKTILNPGDRVLIQDPCWEYLPRIIENCGGIPVKSNFPYHRFQHDWEDLICEIREQLQTGIKAVAINSPLNPTGTVIPPAIMNKMILMCRESNVWFISDDATADFNYISSDKAPAANLSNYVSVNSFSKNLGITGLRIGYVQGSAIFISHLKKAQLYTFMYPNSFIQNAVAEYLSLRPHLYFEFIDRIRSEYRTRADQYSMRLSSIQALEVQRPDGGLFLFAKVRKDSSLTVEELLDKYEVAVAPGSAFSMKCEDRFRMFLGGSEQDMECTAERLALYFA